MNTNAIPDNSRPQSRVAETVRRIAKAFGPLTRPMAGRRGLPIWGVLEHRGRKTGRTYRIPVAVIRTEDGYVIPAPFGGGTQWVRNLEAGGGARLRWKGADYAIVGPEIVQFEAVAYAFNRFQRAGVRAFGISRFVRVRQAV